MIMSTTKKNKNKERNNNIINSDIVWIVNLREREKKLVHKKENT